LSQPEWHTRTSSGLWKAFMETTSW
jgi:hypothetical protein